MLGSHALHTNDAKYGNARIVIIMYSASPAELMRDNQLIYQQLIVS